MFDERSTETRNQKPQMNPCTLKLLTPHRRSYLSWVYKREVRKGWYMDVYVAWGMLSLWGFCRCRKCVNMYTLSRKREKMLLYLRFSAAGR